MGPYIASIPRLFNLNKIKSKKIKIVKNKNRLIVAIQFQIFFNKVKYFSLQYFRQRCKANFFRRWRNTAIHFKQCFIFITNKFTGQKIRCNVSRRLNWQFRMRPTLQKYLSYNITPVIFRCNTINIWKRIFWKKRIFFQFILFRIFI